MKQKLRAWAFHPRWVHYTGSARFWVLSAISAMLVFIFWEVAERIVRGSTEGDAGHWHHLDDKILQVIAEHRSDVLSHVLVDISSMGSSSVITILAIATFLLLAHLRDGRGALYLFLALLGAALGPNILKPIFGRDRPHVADYLVKVSGYSFPSGHSFGASASYLAFAFLATRYFSKPRQQIIVFSFASLIIALVGFSRLYLGVHYPSDVLAGLCAGSAWTFLLSALFSERKTAAG